MLRKLVVVVRFVSVVGVPMRAHQTFELASAQVVESTNRPLVLRIAASGPIAFVEQDREGNGNAGRISVRLYGVFPPATTNSFAATGPRLEAVAVERLDDGTRLTITTPVAAGESLHVGAGARSNELVVERR